MKRRFADCEIDLERHEFRRAGEVVRLEPQVFDLIALLSASPGRLVGREEMVEAVWEGRAVSESAISARIAAARRAVGDDGARQSVIATVPRRGLRFVAEVSEPGDAAPAASVALPEVARRQSVRFARSSDGARIAWATTGEGPPLLRSGVFVGHLEHEWRNPIWGPFFERLCAKFTVTRYDQRGAGLSDRAPPSLELERYVDDLEAVADAAGLDRFVLMGASQSAPISVAFAARRPERVSRLILMGGYATGRMARPGPEERARAEAVQTLIREGWGDPEGPFLTAFATLYMPDARQAQIASIVALQRAAATPEMAARIRAAIDGFDVSDLLETVRAPTLVMHATHDGVQPFEDGLRLARGIPGAELLAIESRNHMLLPTDANWGMLDAAIAFGLEGRTAPPA